MLIIDILWVYAKDNMNRNVQTGASRNGGDDDDEDDEGEAADMEGSHTFVWVPILIKQHQCIW